MFLDASAPGNPLGHDWGEVKHHFTDEATPETDGCVTTKKNCSDWDYSYQTADIDTTWLVVTWSVVFNDYIAYTVDDVEAYWDSKYKPQDGYNKVGSVDYSENCHGYATGVGNWPVSSQYGIGTIVNGAYPFCWPIVDYGHEAHIGVELSDSHSIKVVTSYCDLNGYDTTHTIIGTAEKDSESAIYYRHIPCGLYTAFFSDPNSRNYYLRRNSSGQPTPVWPPQPQP